MMRAMNPHWAFTRALARETLTFSSSSVEYHAATNTMMRLADSGMDTLSGRLTIVFSFFMRLIELFMFLAVFTFCGLCYVDC